MSHHRVAAARALGWTEIDALVIESMVTLETELIEIDENLCRAELTKGQRTAFTKRRAQIWEALHPEEKQKTEVAPSEPPQFSGQLGGARPQKKGFAAATAEATGQSKRDTNKAIAIADAIGLDALDKLTGTSLDSGVELDALAKLPETERTVLIDGHNRFEICTRLGIPFNTVQKDFEGRPQARIWMLDRAFGQRNLGDFQRVENRLAKKADLALLAKANLVTSTGGANPRPLSTLTKPEPINTRTELAKTAGVSAGNVYKVEKILEQASPELLTAVRAGEVTINLASQLATLPKEKQAAGDGLCWRAIGHCCHDTARVSANPCARIKRYS